jgi:rhodanese-related sulfurtransferase/DNA-binding transcriptional ArsR family regulator
MATPDRANPSAHRAVKTALFDELARAAAALANGRRAEIVDVLANGERSVESLGNEVGLTVANTSQHLQVLRQAGLVRGRRDGNFVTYSLSDPSVFELWRAIRSFGAKHRAEINDLADAYLGQKDDLEPITRAELRRRLKAGEDLILIDVRPPEEYAAGHLPQAISLPVTQLRRRLSELPQGREIVAYCRGPYCAFAHAAVRELRRHGYPAQRLEDGLPEWRAAGLPVETGA